VFLANVTRQAAVLHELTIIGEAASRLSAALRQAHPATPWTKIVSFRNVVVHEYFGLNWEIIWDTATELVPEGRPTSAGTRRRRRRSGSAP
jgi:uncharacterized protein with HEPN domain